MPGDSQLHGPEVPFPRTHRARLSLLGAVALVALAAACTESIEEIHDEEDGCVGSESILVLMMWLFGSSWQPPNEFLLPDLG